MKTYAEEAKIAVEKAIQLNHSMGLPVYQIKDGYIVAIYPDSREVRLEKAKIGLEGM